MHRLWLIVSTLLLASAAAFANPHDPRIATTVEPVPEEVSLRRTAAGSGLVLESFAAYKVTITNNAANVLNRVFFRASAINVGSGEALVIDSTVPSSLTCSGLGTASIECSLGSLPKRGGSVQFLVVVRAPASGERIDLAWTGGGDEGKGRGNGCCDQSGVARTDLIDATTDPSFRLQVTSFVRPQGGTFFTGDALPTPADTWTTQLEVPDFTTSAPTTLSIVETPLATSCAPYVLPGGCFLTDVTIPGQFDSLELTFLLDAKAFHLYHAAAAKLFYTGSNPAIQYPIQLGLCTADAVTYAPLPAPSSGRPCLIEKPRKLGKHDYVPKALWGDLQFRVRALDNGRYAN